MEVKPSDWRDLGNFSGPSSAGTVSEHSFDEIRADVMRVSAVLTLWPAHGQSCVLDCPAGDIVGCLSRGTFNSAGARKDRILRPLIQRLLLASALVVLAVTGLVAPARAQARLEAHYSATIAGIPIGTGSWIIDITDTQYSATVNGQTSGLLRAFTGGQGNATARGTLNGGRALSSIYTATITGRGKRIDSIRIAISNGNVKEYKVDPPADDDPTRVPITETSQRGVLDPMTASMVRMPGTGDPLVPEACQRTHEVFDGRLRYDMQFAFKRMERVKAAKGYSGPVVVCAVYFTPVAGFVPTRTTIRYLARQRDMEIWLAPVTGTRVLVPIRAQGPTPIGQAILEASEFVSTPIQAGANGMKTQ